MSDSCLEGPKRISSGSSIFSFGPLVRDDDKSKGDTYSSTHPALERRQADWIPKVSSGRVLAEEKVVREGVEGG